MSTFTERVQSSGRKTKCKTHGRVPVRVVCGECAHQMITDNRDMKKKLEELPPILEQMIQTEKKLRFEIEILRYYGNKDCTAMADAHMRELGFETV